MPVAIPANGIIAATTPQLLGQSYVEINPNFKNPYVETWNLAVQRQLPWSLGLDVSYLGSHGVDSVAQYNLNASTTMGGGTASEPLYQLYKRSAGTTLYFAGYSSHYNAMQVKLDRKAAKSLLVTTSFTWGKGMNYNADDDGALNWYINPQRNYARTDFDRKYTFVQSYVYQLPFGKGQQFLSHGLAVWVLGNWQLSGVLSLYSGTPMTVLASGTSLNTPGETQTANQVASVQLLHGINVGNPWFSTASFTQPTGVTFGNSGRNVFDGPGMFQLNLSLFKNFELTERVKAELRLETFNTTNTPAFANPNSTVGNALYGMVTSTVGSGTGVNGTGGGRAVQLGLKVRF